MNSAYHKKRLLCKIYRQRFSRSFILLERYRRKSRWSIYRFRGLIPLIRATMPPLLCKDIIGIQPMTASTGVTFKLQIEPHEI